MRTPYCFLLLGLTACAGGAGVIEVQVSVEGVLENLGHFEVTVAADGKEDAAYDVPLLDAAAPTTLQRFALTFPRGFADELQLTVAAVDIKGVTLTETTLTAKVDAGKVRPVSVILNQCTDGRKNGFELDVDCGGTQCGLCSRGQACDPSKVGCEAGLTCNVTTKVCGSCASTMMDGDETDIDCGGSTCVPCALGKYCLTDGDCTTSSCINNLCSPPARCSNGAKDADETDVDCGGADCLNCAPGKMCKTTNDCDYGCFAASLNSQAFCRGASPPSSPCTTNNECRSLVCTTSTNLCL